MELDFPYILVLARSFYQFNGVFKKRFFPNLSIALIARLGHVFHIFFMFYPE